MKDRDERGRWQRIEAIVDLPALAEKRVLVAGLGSGGSTLALELAKAGVGHFTLIDYDRLEQANLIRHECDDRDLGRLKAGAVADLIRRRNPGAELETIAENVFDLGPRLEELVAASDLVAVCTDAEPPKHLLNRLALTAGASAVYAGVYARGTGGEIIRCGGGREDPCYACVVSVLKEAAPVPVDPAELDYGAVEADGSTPSAPGLGLDVRLIALLQAKVSLLRLLGREQELGGNVVLFGTAALEGLFPRPFASALITVRPQSDCLVCGFRRNELPDSPTPPLLPAG
jgi:molybdopterin/thiamine biosynthesis adenylyltransferase